MVGDEAQDFSEKRRAARFETSVEVEYTCGENFLFSYMTNISEMGIFIRTDSPLEVGSLLTLRFSAGFESTLVVEGTVAWINPFRPDGDNLNPGMGVRFEKLTPAIREQLVELVRTVAYLKEPSEAEMRPELESSRATEAAMSS
ncbi:MAG: PilZ domain-containing protein [Myxococcota bacterium]